MMLSFLRQPAGYAATSLTGGLKTCSLPFPNTLQAHGRAASLKLRPRLQACKSIRAQHRLLLSGTPIQNDVLELWALFDFLMPGEHSLSALEIAGHARGTFFVSTSNWLADLTPASRTAGAAEQLTPLSSSVCTCEGS